MDWKDIIGIVAPGLATALGGPLAGAAVKILSEKVLGTDSTGDPATDEAKLAEVLSGGLTPEIRAQLLAAEQTLQTEMVRAGVRKIEVAADVEKTYIGDTDKARQSHASNVGVLRLGYLINFASYVTIGGVLWGCFKLLSSPAGVTIDPGTAAMLGGILGAAVQWLMANAAQANGFFFGSSPGARQLTEQLGKAVTGAVDGAARR